MTPEVESRGPDPIRREPPCHGHLGRGQRPDLGGTAHGNGRNLVRLLRREEGATETHFQSRREEIFQASLRSALDPDTARAPKARRLRGLGERRSVKHDDLGDPEVLLDRVLRPAENQASPGVLGHEKASVIVQVGHVRGRSRNRSRPHSHVSSEVPRFDSEHALRPPRSRGVWSPDEIVLHLGFADRTPNVDELPVDEEADALDRLVVPNQSRDRDLDSGFHDVPFLPTLRVDDGRRLVLVRLETNRGRDRRFVAEDVDGRRRHLDIRRRVDHRCDQARTEGSGGPDEVPVHDPILDAGHPPVVRRRHLDRNELSRTEDLVGPWRDPLDLGRSLVRGPERRGDRSRHDVAGQITDAGDRDLHPTIRVHGRRRQEHSPVAGPQLERRRNTLAEREVRQLECGAGERLEVDRLREDDLDRRVEGHFDVPVARQRVDDGRRDVVDRVEARTLRPGKVPPREIDDRVVDPQVVETEVGERRRRNRREDRVVVAPLQSERGEPSTDPSPQLDARSSEPTDVDRLGEPDPDRGSPDDVSRSGFRIDGDHHRIPLVQREDSELDDLTVRGQGRESLDHPGTVLRRRDDPNGAEGDELELEVAVLVGHENRPVVVTRMLEGDGHTGSRRRTVRENHSPAHAALVLESDLQNDDLPFLGQSAGRGTAQRLGRVSGRRRQTPSGNVLEGHEVILARRAVEVGSVSDGKRHRGGQRHCRVGDGHPVAVAHRDLDRPEGRHLDLDIDGVPRLHDSTGAPTFAAQPTDLGGDHGELPRHQDAFELEGVLGRGSHHQSVLFDPDVDRAEQTGLHSGRGQDAAGERAEMIGLELEVDLDPLVLLVDAPLTFGTPPAVRMRRVEGERSFGNPSEEELPFERGRGVAPEWPQTGRLQLDDLPRERSSLGPQESVDLSPHLELHIRSDDLVRGRDLHHVASAAPSGQRIESPNPVGPEREEPESKATGLVRCDRVEETEAGELLQLDLRVRDGFPRLRIPDHALDLTVGLDLEDGENLLTLGSEEVGSPSAQATESGNLRMDRDLTRQDVLEDEVSGLVRRVDPGPIRERPLAERDDRTRQGLLILVLDPSGHGSLRRESHLDIELLPRPRDVHADLLGAEDESVLPPGLDPIPPRRDEGELEPALFVRQEIVVRKASTEESQLRAGSRCHSVEVENSSADRAVGLEQDLVLVDLPVIVDESADDLLAVERVVDAELVGPDEHVRDLESSVGRRLRDQVGRIPGNEVPFRHDLSDAVGHVRGDPDLLATLVGDQGPEPDRPTPEAQRHEGAVAGELDLREGDGSIVAPNRVNTVSARILPFEVEGSVRGRRDLVRPQGRPVAAGEVESDSRGRLAVEIENDPVDATLVEHFVKEKIRVGRVPCRDSHRRRRLLGRLEVGRVDRPAPSEDSVEEVGAVLVRRGVERQSLDPHDRPRHRDHGRVRHAPPDEPLNTPAPLR